VSALVLAASACDGPGLEPPFGGDDDSASGGVGRPGSGVSTPATDAGAQTPGVPSGSGGSASGAGGSSSGASGDFGNAPVLDPDEMEPPLPEPMSDLDAGVEEP
jgi:hypothetical protein